VAPAKILTVLRTADPSLTRITGRSVHVADRNHPPPFRESSMSGKVPARRDANGIQ
jgi:hypothetical protein